MTYRKAHRIFKPGSLKRLKLVDENLDESISGEVTVKVKAIGLNFADIFAIKGLYSATPETSFVPGLEYSGDIIDPGDSNFMKGQRVMGVTRFGAYSDHLNIDNRYLTPLPDDWSYEEGAAFQVQVLTAYYALVVLGNLQKDDKVLIHSAAGGVGIWANRIAKKKGAFTIGTVGNKSKYEVLENERYDKYLERGKDFRKSYSGEIGEDIKPNIVLECIGGKVLMDSYKLMERMGRLITYGSAHFSTQTNGVNYFSLLPKYLNRPKFDPMKMATSNKSVMGFNLIWLFDKAHLYRKYMDEIIGMNLGKPTIGHHFNFENIIDALKFFQSGKSIGKIIIAVD